MGIPDQTGRVILITGATSGLGRAAAEALAAAGATTIVAGRSAERVGAAVDAIGRATGIATGSATGRSTGAGTVHPLVMDVSSLAAVRAGAAEVLDRFDRLDVLVNNAGVVLSERQLSVDGFEMTMATNHLGHFLLTNLLLDRLKASAPARVVNVASTAHRAARSVGLDDFNSEKRYLGMAVYNRSKLANILFTKELARRLQGTGVTAYAVHPGTVRTGWGQDGDTGGLMGVGLKVIRPFFLTPQGGATSLLYAATEPGIESRSGGYFFRSALGQYGPVREAQPSGPARDAEAARQLWEASVAMTGATAAGQPGAG